MLNTIRYFIVMAVLILVIPATYILSNIAVHNNSLSTNLFTTDSAKFSILEKILQFFCLMSKIGMPNIYIIKEEKFRRMAATQMSGRHKYFSSSYFGRIVSCLLYTTLNEIIIFD